MCPQNLTPLGNLEFALKEGHTQKENKNLLLSGITQLLQIADWVFAP